MPFSDNFNDNNLTGWTIGFRSLTDILTPEPGVSVVAANGQLEITPFDGPETFNYNGAYVTATENVNNTRTKIKVINPLLTGIGFNYLSYFGLVKDSNNYFVFYTSGTILSYKAKQAGTATEGEIGSFNGTNHLYCSVRVELSNIFFETSPNGVDSWTLHATVPLTIATTGFSPEILGGTSAHYTGSEKFIFDDVEVIAISSSGPVVNAGADQSLIAGTTSTTVTATASDPDGGTPTVVWSKTSGPNTPTITSPTSLSTTITGLVAGTYVFRCTATDNESEVGYDEVQVIVASAQPSAAFFVEDFNDGNYSPNLVLGGAYLSAAGIPRQNTTLVAQNQRLEMLVDPAVASGRWNGLQSATGFTLNSVAISIEAIEPRVSGVSYNEITWFGVFNAAATTYYAIRVNRHLIQWEYKENGGSTQQGEQTYVPAAMRWWRIRHDGAAIHFEVSADGTSNWTELRAPVTPGVGVSLANMKAELGAGVVTATQATQTVLFDNFSVINLTAQPPNANAGTDVTARGGTTVSLSGIGTTGFGAITYAWTQISGTAVTLINPNTATPSFTAPIPAGDNTELTFRLTATNASGSTTDDVQVGIVKADAVTHRIQFSNPQIEFVVGPLIMAGSAKIPNVERFERVYRRELEYWTNRYPSVQPSVIKPGTVSVTQGSTTVTGTGSSFLTEIEMNPLVMPEARNKITFNRNGVMTEYEIASIQSDTQLTLAVPYAETTASGVSWNTAGVAEANKAAMVEASRYDLGRIAYMQFYRTGLTKWRDAGRKVIDSIWAGDGIRNGDGTVPGGEIIAVHNRDLAGHILRALDGKPERWDYLHRWQSSNFDTLVYARRLERGVSLNGWKLLASFQDGRVVGWMLRWSVYLSQVLPNTYPLYANGTKAAQTGTATDGATKRADYATQVRESVINGLQFMQNTDGSFRWDANSGELGIVQPFMEGTLLDGLAYSHTIMSNSTDKSITLSIMKKLLDFLYSAPRYRQELMNNTLYPGQKWRLFFYFAGGGMASNFNLWEPTATGFPFPESPASEYTLPTNVPDKFVYRGGGRNQNGYLVHGAMYYYTQTGNSAYLSMADDYYDSIFGDDGFTDPITGRTGDGMLAQGTLDTMSGKPKEFGMAYHMTPNAIALRYSSTSNQTPTVNAGVDQNLAAGTTSTTLTGTASDPDNDTLTKTWSRISGPNIPTIVSPTSLTTSITGLTAGTYVFRLTVNDGVNGNVSDDVQVVVASAGGANNPPVVNAGTDQNLNAGTTTTTLTGTASDPDGDPLTKTWTRVSGPNTPTITSANTLSTNVLGLIAGTYVFRLTVSDGVNSPVSDDVIVNVATTTTLSVTAGDKIIPNNTNKTTIKGSATSSGSTSLTKSWSQVSGPNVAVINNPTAWSTVVDNLIEGTYVFRLTVSDGINTKFDDMTITKLPHNRTTTV